MSVKCDKVIGADGKEIFFAPCGEEDLPRLLLMQEEVFAELKDVSLLRRNSPEMLLACLQAPNYTLGAWVNNCAGAGEITSAACKDEKSLVAFSVLFFPRDDSENLSLSLHNVEVDRSCSTAANNKLCIVSKAYRGRGLQLRLGRRIEDEARQRGVELLCATASPCNAPSCRSLERQGYELNRRLTKYGYPRCLYVKRLE